MFGPRLSDIPDSELTWRWWKVEGPPVTAAELCPVCGGAGKYAANHTDNSTLEQQCHGCGGLGWVKV